jgi:predicted membrane GTPase involved in stress response
LRALVHSSLPSWYRISYSLSLSPTEDDYVEVTPSHIRFRKKELDESKRARAVKNAKNARKAAKKK